MKIRLALWIYALIMVAISSCYYDVEERLYPAEICDTTNITYALTVKPILDANCNLSGCHNTASASAGIALEQYSQVKSYIDQPKFIGSLWHDAAYSAMPKNAAALSACQIRKLDQWRLNGSPNN